MNFLEILKKDAVSHKLTMWTVALVLFSSIHHVYGGLLYETSWRVIMPLTFFIPMLVVTLILQFLAVSKLNRGILIAYTFLVFVGWILIMAVGEGGYNHLVKNILHFSGASEELMIKLFPPEFGGEKMYEIPNDFIFEVTGILTTVFGFFLTYYLVRFFNQIWKKSQK